MHRHHSGRGLRFRPEVGAFGPSEESSQAKARSSSTPDNDCSNFASCLIATSLNRDLSREILIKVSRQNFTRLTVGITNRTAACRIAVSSGLVLICLV